MSHKILTNTTNNITYKKLPKGWQRLQVKSCKKASLFQLTLAKTGNRVGISRISDYLLQNATLAHLASHPSVWGILAKPKRLEGLMKPTD